MRIILLLGLLCAGGVSAATNDKGRTLPAVDAMQSFEDGVPWYVHCDNGKLSTSERYAQDGRFSLRWDWVPGDRLTVKIAPLGNINVWTGYSHYLRSAMKINIFNESPQESDFTFRWMKGDRCGGYFIFPLHVPGWQHICYHYSWHNGISGRNTKLLQESDRIVLEAPATGKGGTIYLDSLVVNKPYDWRDANHPITKVWKPYDLNDYPHQELIAPPATPEELAAVEKFLPKRNKNGKVSEKRVAAFEKKMREKYNFRTLADGHVTGRSAGWKEMSGDLKQTADMWHNCGDDALADRIAKIYFLLDDHFRTLGAVPQGSITGLHNYSGRTHGDACFAMREPLLKSGRLERVRNTLKYNYNYRQMFEDGPAPRSMDFHYNDVRYIFKIALMHDTPQEIVKHLRIFKKAYDRWVVDTIKPDGSLYHHGKHYFAYAGGAMASTADTFMRTLGTPFQPGKEAFEAVKKALLNMRYYANLLDLPVTMHGRHPGRQQLKPATFLRMAQAGRAYNNGRLDPELAAAYLRLNPKDTGKPEFTKEQIKPEPPPHGNLAMNFAGIMGQRRGEWLALVRGYGKYYGAGESYNNQNRYGLVFGNGCLTILASGTPVNIISGGHDVNRGWDWRMFDGATVIYMPYNKMANGNGSLSESNGNGFIGGLSQNRRNGIFVMPIRSGLQYGKALDKGQKHPDGAIFKANKSYFFFDDRIVCLGSDIAAPALRYPVYTVLFQDILTGTNQPVTVDGSVVTNFPYEAALTVNSSHTLLDIQNTGYLIPAGQKIAVARRHQKSRDGHDSKDTEGDAALAWIDHGNSPTNSSYRYFIQVKTTPAELQRFASQMQSEQPPVTVLRQDSRSHIVYDRATRTAGYVIFKAGKLSTNAITHAVTFVSQPCLVTVQDAGKGRVNLSLADPDLHIVKGISQSTNLTIRIRGELTAEAVPDGTRVAANNAGETAITLSCVNGASYDLVLRDAAYRPAQPKVAGACRGCSRTVLGSLAASSLLLLIAIASIVRRNRGGRAQQH